MNEEQKPDNKSIPQCQQLGRHLGSARVHCDVGCTSSTNQGAQRAFRHLVARCNHSRKHLLSRPSRAKPQLCPSKSVSTRQFRAMRCFTSSVPARVAGMACHGMEPMTLISSSGTCACFEVSFCNATNPVFWSTTYLRHFRNEHSRGNGIGPNAMSGKLRRQSLRQVVQSSFASVVDVAGCFSSTQASEACGAYELTLQ
jgi:hypothetical protein